MSKEVYIAGPLFNTMENNHNEDLTKLFESHGYDVFNPIRDGVEAAEEFTGDYSAQMCEQIYTIDTDMIEECRIFAANLDGIQVDDGTAFEIGYAMALGGKLMLGHLTDTRMNVPPFPRNPMVYQPFKFGNNMLFDDRQELVRYALVMDGKYAGIV